MPSGVMGLPEGTQAFRGADDTLDTRRLYDTDEEGRFLTLTEMDEWKKAVADLTARAEKAEAALKQARKEAFEEVRNIICVFCEGDCALCNFRALAEKENENART